MDWNATGGGVRMQLGEVPVWPKEGLEQRSEDVRMHPRSEIDRSEALEDSFGGVQGARHTNRGTPAGTAQPRNGAPGCLTHWQLVRERVRDSTSASHPSAQGTPTHTGLPVESMEMNPRHPPAPPPVVTARSNKHSRNETAGHVASQAVEFSLDDVAVGEGSCQTVNGRVTRDSSSDHSSQSTPVALRSSDVSSCSGGIQSDNCINRKSSSSNSSSSNVESDRLHVVAHGDSGYMGESGESPLPPPSETAAAGRLRSGEFQAHYAAVLSRVTEEGGDSSALIPEVTAGYCSSVPASQTSSELRHGCMIAMRVNSEVFEGMVADACGAQDGFQMSAAQGRAGSGKEIAGQPFIQQGRRMDRGEVSADRQNGQLMGSHSHVHIGGRVGSQGWQGGRTVGRGPSGNRQQHDDYHGKRGHTSSGTATAAAAPCVPHCVVDVQSSGGPARVRGSRFGPHGFQHGANPPCTAACCVAGGDEGDEKGGDVSEESVGRVIGDGRLSRKRNGSSSSSSNRGLLSRWPVCKWWSLLLLSCIAAALAM